MLLPSLAILSLLHVVNYLANILNRTLPGTNKIKIKFYFGTSTKIARVSRRYHSGLMYNTNILIAPDSNALSIGSGPVAAVSVYMKRDVIY